ncbi:hypothetical protein KUTeg_009979 [Tegillarca granosa]|uniref:Alpha-carbonic anhydrase domain-containing protein n=1 Tax=Tegillarca granosa TaxID=220873 RepID=A0ABQ9F5F6_TEGGR|nr:hypothetical protein KUTeg_009979 [Tegillarca granosa]
MLSQCILFFKPFWIAQPTSKRIMVRYAVFIILFIFGHSEGAGWSYVGEHGPAHWASSFQHCGGSSQSPINIPGASSLVYDEGLSQFTLNGFGTSSSSTYQLKNNGHSVQLTIGGNVNLHIVNYNSKYPGLAVAADKSDGLAVLGFWFRISETDNPNYNTLLSQFDNVMFKDKMANVSGINLQNLLPSDLSHYYRYQGSLTTPPCFESVTWTLFNSMIPISERQMQKFRSLSELTMPDQHSLLVNNYRPLQALNSRKVYTSSPSQRLFSSSVQYGFNRTSSSNN